MVPRLIHHLLRLCAIIVSIVCSTVLTVCAPFHSLVLVLSFFHPSPFYHSVSRCRQFVYFNLCVNPLSRATKWVLYLVFSVSSVIHRSHTVLSRLKYTKTRIYLHAIVYHVTMTRDISRWMRQTFYIRNESSDSVIRGFVSLSVTTSID